MLTIFKKIFGKAPPKAAVPTPQQQVPAPPSTPMPQIEVAHLSLGAITGRFTDELKPLLANEPGEAATVALPMPTILKQLPVGVVKMSLATLQRQSQGLIRPLPPGDKRMVDVPLKEIFRHVKLTALKRRPDQRPVMIPETGFNLFGDATNPFSVSPDDHLEQVSVVDLSSDVREVEDTTVPSAAGPRVLKMDDGLRQHFANTPTARSGSVADSPSTIKFEASDSGPRASAAAPANYGVSNGAAPIEKPTGPTLDLKLSALCANWPEDVKQEIATLDPETKVTLPQEEIGAGLGRGRVIFSWGHIRAWMEPAPTAPTIAAENVQLQLPLKIVAPAFLAASKSPKAERKSFNMDESIPTLFNGGREPAPKPAPAAPAAEAAPVHAEEPVQAEAPVHEEAAGQAEAPAHVEEPVQPEAPVHVEEPVQAEAPAHVEEPVRVEVPVQAEEPVHAEAPAPVDAPIRVEVPVQAETPAQVEEPVRLEVPVQVEAPAHVEPPVHIDAPLFVRAIPVPEVSEAPAAEAEPTAVVAAVPQAHKTPETVGELFGEPHKKDWTPTEIVTRTVKLPGVAGAIVALQEGLQVASSLPDGVKSEVVAAFLPQIFARLNQYAGEMKLGDVDDLLFTTHGAHCQIYRLGYIYLAVLGKPGESLPWHELRIISEELARQTHK
jgi:predicted regulator of Ras-like GTPase activity (Roadblock/LC7/MglB family)